MRPSVRGGEGCRYQAVRQKVCGIPVTSTAAGVSYQTHTLTHTVTRAGDADFLSISSSTAALVLRSAGAHVGAGESVQGISIPEPRWVSFLFKKVRMNFIEVLIIRKLQCAKILLLMLLLSISSSSPPLPHPLLHLGDIKKLQPLTSPKLLAAATGTGGDQAQPVLLSEVFFSSARDEQRPVRLTEALQHYPSNNQVAVLRKRTYSGQHLQNNNKRSSAEFQIG